MSSADSNNKLVNLLIAEFDDSDEKQDPGSVARFLEQRQVSETVAAAVRRHFTNAAELRRKLSNSPPDSSPNDEIPPSIGPYRLVKKLGEGGMGSVWLAAQEEPIRRQVAIKLMRPGYESAEFLKRFETERQAQAMMDHPHVAKLLDAGTTTHDSPYFVMEYLPGESLTRYCRQNRLDTRSRLALFLDLCDAIQHAHQKGVIHRDIKPSNVIVSEIDSKPVVKVIDFGLARSIDAQNLQLDAMTQFGTVVGSLPYMSPEQARGARGSQSGEDIDTRTDVYSLGAVLFELLTGTTPIRKEEIRAIGLVETLRRIQEVESPRPSVRLQEPAPDEAKGATGIDHQRMRQLVGDLDWIVIKALEIDRERRYDAVAELARDVERFLEDEPISARPPSRVYLMRKFVRKHRFAVTSSTLVVAALFIGLVLAAWQANRARIANIELTVTNRTLAQRNLELDQANQLEVRLRREQVEAQIGNMVDRGQWLEASRDIEMLKTQTAAPLPPRIQLANLAVLDGLQQTSEFKQALRATAAQNWDAEYAGERDLWRAYGYLLDGNVEVDPADLIQNALESGTLNKGDAYFARGLLAESLDESVQLYRQALKFSSFHLRARLQLVITLVLMGRRDEAAYEAAVAIDFFPDDLRFYHASALNAALGANRPATLKAIELSKSKFPKVDTSYILSALRLAGEFDRVLSTIEEVSPLSWLNLAVQLRTISLSGLNSIPVQEFHKPQVFEAFQHYMSCLTRPTFLIANAGKKFDLLMQASRESYEIHPDAFFLQCEGMVLLTIGRFAEAETVFCKAMEGFSLFPAVSREARFFAYASRAGVFGNSKRREDLEKAVEYLDDYPMSKITPARFVLAFEGLARAGRWDKVRELCEGLTCENDQRRSMMMTVARRAEEYENDGFAVTTWEDLLAEFPGDPELIEARTGLIKKLATQVEKSSDPADK